MTWKLLKMQRSHVIAKKTRRIQVVNEEDGHYRHSAIEESRKKFMECCSMFILTCVCTMLAQEINKTFGVWFYKLDGLPVVSAAAIDYLPQRL